MLLSLGLPEIAVEACEASVKLRLGLFCPQVLEKVRAESTEKILSAALGSALFGNAQSEA